MANLDNLETEIEEIKKQLAFLSKNSGDSSQNSSDWTVLFDYESEDENLNFGQTTGIHGAIGYIDNFPDLAPFKELKVVWQTNGAFDSWYFDISNPAMNTYHMIACSRDASQLYFGNLVIQYEQNTAFTGKRKISFADSYKITLSNKAYPVFTNISTNDLYFIRKIYAR